jgi:hypothetical protein
VCGRVRVPACNTPSTQHHPLTRIPRHIHATHPHPLPITLSQDLLVAKEKGEVGKVLSAALRCLNAVDVGLPQVLRMSEMLRRGVGVHHGGLLPIIKETVRLH